MRKKYIFGKKLYISVLTSILVLLTTVATTFAWVGVFANSTFETFNIDLKASHLDEYGIEISFETTAPAPMITWSQIWTPSRIVAFAPIQTSFPISIPLFLCTLSPRKNKSTS